MENNNHVNDHTLRVAFDSVESRVATTEVVTSSSEMEAIITNLNIDAKLDDNYAELKRISITTVNI